MKKINFYSCRILLIVLSLQTLFFCSGCVFVKYSGIEPISPKAGFIPADAESLEPTLRWNDPKVTPGSRYDVGIWNTMQTASGVFRDDRIYFRENVSGPEHRVDIKLAPGHTYYWSVRASGSTGWSSSDILSIGTGSSRERDVYFVFTTPKR